MRSLSEIIFWLFAQLRPVLWYAHRLAHFLDVALLCLADERYRLWLEEHPESRAWLEGVIADGERMLDIALGLRTRELLGLPMPAGRPGLRGCVRIHAAPSLDHLTLRLARLTERYARLETLARRRAARLNREAGAAPILLEPDHRPAAGLPAVLALLLSSPFSVFPRPVSAAPPGLHIRAPP